jgi:hypothetical protein
MKFIINITRSNNKHALVSFEVPQDVLTAQPPETDLLEVAGWYYMNFLDGFSCTGPYRWSVISWDVFEAFKASI